MLIGYARTSTVEQEAGFEAQVRDLKAAGCEDIFQEQVSSVAARSQLEAAIAFARKGDVFVVTKLDRFARSVTNMWELVRRLQAKGVELQILSMNVDTRTAQGKLYLTIMGGVAEFEREMMLERQREGIAKAKSLGKYTGRKPTARAKADQVKALSAAGRSMGQIATELGISKGSVHAILSAAA